MTAAQRAARDLPGTSRPGLETQDRGTRAYVIFGTLFLMAVPVVMAVFMLTLPWGWAALLASIALCAAGRRIWGLIAPDQVVASVVVDRDGVVRALVGATMITAYRKMFTTGPRRWVLRGAALGCGLVIVAVLAGILAGVLLFDASVSYFPIFIELLAGMLGLASTMYNGIFVPWRAGTKGYRILEADLVLPLLGLYAKRHGDAAARRGVPADELLATAGDASPEETAAIAEQVAAAAFFRKLTGAGPG